MGRLGQKGPLEKLGLRVWLKVPEVKSFHQPWDLNQIPSDVMVRGSTGYVWRFSFWSVQICLCFAPGSFTAFSLHNKMLFGFISH